MVDNTRLRAFIQEEGLTENGETAQDGERYRGAKQARGKTSRNAISETDVLILGFLLVFYKAL